MRQVSFSADNIGIMASSACIVHCVGTPFLFFAKACSSVCCADAPVWWQLMDYLFLIICFFAIYFSTRGTCSNYMKSSFWTTWTLLLLLLINHTAQIFPAHPYLIYIPSTILIILHFYNIKYCKCKQCH